MWLCMTMVLCDSPQSVSVSSLRNQETIQCESWYGLPWWNRLESLDQLSAWLQVVFGTGACRSSWADKTTATCSPPLSQPGHWPMARKKEARVCLSEIRSNSGLPRTFTLIAAPSRSLFAHDWLARPGQHSRVEELCLILPVAC